jgi:endogenous inhibitor of DNA gyrase (YacG/DUF329 family)
MPACPICKRPVSPRAQNKAFPFCDARCKQVDLGQWLNEKYRVATDESADDETDGDTSVNRHTSLLEEES